MPDLKSIAAQIHSLRSLENHCGKRRDIDEHIRQLQAQQRQLRAQGAQEPEEQEGQTEELEAEGVGE
jgi:hypothetical protein